MGEINLPSDFLDFFVLLNNHKVNYMIVGSWAVAYHAQPRYTKDIDILVECSDVNAQKLMKVVDEFGFGSVGIAKEDFLKEAYVIQLGFEPNRIDILTKIDGVDFATAFKRHVVAKITQIDLPFLSIEDLVSAKKTAARPQDVADLAKLEKFKK